LLFENKLKYLILQAQSRCPALQTAGKIVRQNVMGMLTYSQIITIFQSGIKSILFPLIGSFAVKNFKGRIEKGLNMLFDLTLKLIIPLSLILVVISSDVIRFIYSERYADASIFVLFTIIGAVINILILAEPAIFYGFDKLKDKNKYAFIKSVIYLPILFILVFYFSGIGASIAYFILSVINVLIFIYFLKKYDINVKFDKPLILMIPFFIISLYLLLDLKIITIIILLIYSFSVFKFNLISKKTKSYIIKKIRSRRISEKILRIII
jgi:O-antigen/teichoic acid export membrane protein